MPISYPVNLGGLAVSANEPVSALAIAVVNHRKIYDNTQFIPTYTNMLWGTATSAALAAGASATLLAGAAGFYHLIDRISMGCNTAAWVLECFLGARGIGVFSEGNGLYIYPDGEIGANNAALTVTNRSGAAVNLWAHFKYQNIAV